MEEKKRYLEEIKKYTRFMYDRVLTEEEIKILEKLLDDEWVQFIYEAGYDNGYEKF